MFVFRPRYFLFAILIFIIEVLIALYVNDEIIRPYLGDVLVVMMIYCFIRAFFNCRVWSAALFTLLFSYLIETLQYFNIVERLGLQQYTIPRVVIGTYFTWIDIIAYTAGILLVLILEHISKRNNFKPQ